MSVQAGGAVRRLSAVIKSTSPSKRAKLLSTFLCPCSIRAPFHQARAGLIKFVAFRAWADAAASLAPAGVRSLAVNRDATHSAGAGDFGRRLEQSQQGCPKFTNFQGHGKQHPLGANLGIANDELLFAVD